MPYSVGFSPEAQDQLADIYRYIGQEASPQIARRYTDAIVAHCEQLQEFPQRAVRRDDMRSGLHVTNYKNRVTIAYYVDAGQVYIIGVFYGGRNYETLLRSDLDDENVKEPNDILYAIGSSDGAPPARAMCRAAQPSRVFAG